MTDQPPDQPPEQPDASRLAGRARRYASVGRNLGGFAAGYALRKITGRAVGDKAAHAAALTEALGGLKGPLMKAAQILATIPDALPKEYAEALRQLQADAPPMGWPFVKRRMAGELGPGWEAKFAAFGREAVRAASLGQVHQARAADGRLLACKLQYPDMASTVAADIRQLKLIMGLQRQFDGTIDTRDVQAELEERLSEELDYRREAKHQRLYGAILAGTPDVAVPEPLEDLSTGRLLTMTWLEGTPFLKYLAQHPEQETRDRIALAMFRAWYKPFYGYGVIHGDPHLGNYTLAGEGQVNLLDFGCVRVFPPRFVWGVIALAEALRRNDDAQAVAAYEAWGFRDIGKELLAVLNLWARFLYAPLIEDRAQAILERGSQEGAEVASKVHAELKRLGGVRPPREFVLMDRAAVGLGSVFMHLKAQVNWHRLYQELTQDFDVEVLARRQQAALAAAGLAV